MIPQVSSNVFYLAVSADGKKLQDGGSLRGDVSLGQNDVNWQYALMLSSGSANYLYPPGVAATISYMTGTSINVSWTSPFVGNEQGKNLVPANGLTYFVFAAARGFSAAGADIVTTTACGLSRWQAAARYEPNVVINGTWAVLTGLQPNTPYEVTVLAECGPVCWAASQERMLSVSGAPGYVVQRVAYPVTQTITGDASAVPVEHAFPKAATISIIVILVAIAIGGFVYYKWKIAKTGNREYQYSSLDTEGRAMDTISTPAKGAGGKMKDFFSVFKADDSADPLGTPGYRDMKGRTMALME
jgi:hypothetical protein